ncbi:MAG: hydrolase [Candidatus Peribacteraceae bacterium]|jgi:hypothetical protein
MENATDQCCPTFRPEKWEGKTHHWQGARFLRETIPTFFHIPFPPMIGKRITKMWKAAHEAQAEPPREDWLVLFNDPTPFRSELLMGVTKPVEGADNVQISGTFVSKVYDGSYNAMPKFMKEMDAYLQGQNSKASTYYIHYAYCPKCAKEAGHNYMVLFAQTGV